MDGNIGRNGKRDQHVRAKELSTHAEGRRALVKGALVGLPILALPAAAGGFLASLGVRAAQAQAGDRAGLRGAHAATLRRRFLVEARRRSQPPLTDRQAASAIKGSEFGRVGGNGSGGISLASTAPPVTPNILVRMRHDLERALAKPVDQRKWTMVIDLRKCIGCSACSVACKSENKLPPGVVYRPVIEEEEGKYPNVTRRFLPRPCMHCDDPPCVPVCPVGATWKQDDGIVVIDYEKCIGCRYCIAACPYGARYFDFGINYTDGTPSKQPYEQVASPEYGREWRRRGTQSPIGNVRKCQFCLHRLNVGMLPACVTTCVGGATYFGDQNDAESLVSELLASGRTMRLKEELGTNPKVYYLI